MAIQTQREKILQKAMALLIAAGLPAYRSRAEAFAREEMPAVVLKPGGEESLRLGNRAMSRTFRMMIEVHAVADSAANPQIAADQAADVVIAQVHAALFAPEVFDDLLNDLVDKEMQEPAFADADETRVYITLAYEAMYATAERSITERF